MALNWWRPKYCIYDVTNARKSCILFVVNFSSHTDLYLWRKFSVAHWSAPAFFLWPSDRIRAIHLQTANYLVVHKNAIKTPYWDSIVTTFRWWTWVEGSLAPLSQQHSSILDLYLLITCKYYSNYYVKMCMNLSSLCFSLLNFNLDYHLQLSIYLIKNKNPSKL